MMKRISAVMALAAAALAAPGIAGAAFPEKPISLVVMSSPGGGSDTTARTIAPYLEKHLGGGASIAVINKPGAGGDIGHTFLAKSAPDGYTIGQGLMPVIVSKQFEKQSARYNQDSFDYIGNIVSDGIVIAVRKDSPIKSLSELVSYTKANPNKLTCAHPGIGAAVHLNMLKFERLTGAKIRLIPFRGGGKARNAFLGEHTDAVCLNSSGIAKQVKKVRVLGIATPKPSKAFPGVGTFRDQGVNLVGGSQRLLIAPKGVPAEALGKLRAALKAAMADPAFEADAKKRRLPLDYIDGPQLERDIRADADDFKQLWETSPWLKK